MRRISLRRLTRTLASRAESGRELEGEENEEMVNQGFNKGMVVELFLLFIAWCVSHIKHPVKKVEDRQHSVSVPQGIPDSRGISPAIVDIGQSTKEERVTEILFFVLLIHTVAIGYGFMGNSPFGIVICYIHLIFVVGTVVCVYKEKSIAWKILLLLTGVLNIMLIIYGLAEISSYPNTV